MFRMQCAARGLVAGRPFELAQEIANRQPSCSSDWLTVSLRGQIVQVVLRLRVLWLVSSAGWVVHGRERCLPGDGWAADDGDGCTDVLTDTNRAAGGT